MITRFSRLRVIAVLIFIALLILTALVVVRQKNHADPVDLFYGAIEHNLTESGLSCTIRTNVNGAESKQSISLDLISKNRLRSVLTAKPKPTTTVELEEINVPAGNFVRYISIKTSDVNADGKKPEFKDVVNVWSKTEKSAGQPTLFGRTVLGNCVVPIAHLDNAKAKIVMKEVQKGNIFETDFDDVKTSKIEGRKVLEYKVSVQPRPYIDIMKQVAIAYGLNDLDTIEPSTFDDKLAENVKFYINTGTGNIERIEYTERSHSITFSDYGTIPQVTAPHTYITSLQLQERLKL